MQMLSISKPGIHLSSILQPQVVRAGTSLRNLASRTIAANPELDVREQKLVKRTLAKLQNNPEAVVTNRQTKVVMQALGKAGFLRAKYQANPYLAVNHVQAMHQAIQQNEKSAALDQAESDQEQLSPAEKKKQDFEKKKKIWARTRAERLAERDETRPRVRSLGLNQWREAATSVSQLQRKKSETDKKSADDEKNKKEKPLMEMMID